MSVRTAADEHLDSARGFVDSALKNLNAIVVGQCWGHDEFIKEFAQQIREAHAMLIDVRDKLSR